MNTGKCLCGQVLYEISGQIEDIVYCHCSQCRQAQGSAFASNGNVRKENFKFIQGEQLLSFYEGQPGNVKYFCKNCGSPIMNLKQEKPDVVRIRLGSLEKDVDNFPSAHILSALRQTGIKLMMTCPSMTNL